MKFAHPRKENSINSALASSFIKKREFSKKYFAGPNEDQAEQTVFNLYPTNLYVKEAAGSPKIVLSQSEDR